MEPAVFAAVLLAAALHAGWNAVVKGGIDPHLGVAGVIIGHVPYALVALAFVPAPDPASWPYLLAGMALHFGYQVFLINAYRIGDLTQVYPLARGSAPLVVAAVSVTLLGVEFSGAEVSAILLIGTGLIGLGLVRRGDGLRNPRAAGLALATGCFIAGYSLVDGLGARAAGTGFGFYSWLALGNAAIFAVFLGVTRPKTLAMLPHEGRTVAIVGGGASYLAYSLVVWAFTQAPIALVTALRETSIVFALLIGVGVLKERLDLAKLVATVVTLFGAFLLRLS